MLPPLVPRSKHLFLFPATKNPSQHPKIHNDILNEDEVPNTTYVNDASERRLLLAKLILFGQISKQQQFLLNTFMLRLSDLC